MIKRAANLRRKIGTMARIDGVWGQYFKVIPCLREAIFISILQMEPANDRNNVFFSGNLFCIFNNVSYSRVRTACDYHQSIFCFIASAESSIT